MSLPTTTDRLDPDKVEALPIWGRTLRREARNVAPGVPFRRGGCYGVVLAVREEGVEVRLDGGAVDALGLRDMVEISALPVTLEATA